MMTRGPTALRWFWRIYVPIAILSVAVMLAGTAGSAVEGAIWPIRLDQRIEGITRTADRLCWTWVSYKARNTVSDNMDVFLDTATDHLVLAVFERDTLMPWGRSRAVGVGEHHQPYCITMPPSIGPAERVRLTQVAYYPGFHGLWHTSVRLPDIASPPAPP